MTDHAAEARGDLAWADSYQKGSDVALSTYMAARAQVHATLALAEEQRTANLIALFDMGATDAGPDILARLGLTPTTLNQEQNR